MLKSLIQINNSQRSLYDFGFSEVDGGAAPYR